MSDDQSSTDNDYDTSGNVTKQTTTVGGVPYVYTATFNGFGDLTEQGMPGKVTQKESYSRDGQLTALGYWGTASNGDPTPMLAWTITSDVQGRTIGLETNASSNGTTVGRTLTYGYDNASRLLSATDSRGETCQARTYGFDVNGNRTEQVITSYDGDDCTNSSAKLLNVDKKWSYNDADRASNEAQITTDTYDTDANGNPTSTTTQAGGTTAYTFDALGRATRVPAGDAPANQQAETLGQSGTGQDITIGYYDTDAARSITSGSTTTTYKLDPSGRRATSTVTTPTANPVDTTRDYGDDSDNPSYATAGAVVSVTGRPSAVTSVSPSPVVSPRSRSPTRTATRSAR
ncbi:hypothetical protein [Cellulomonas alba]|uniref:Type IV secretion protein Rhs n=1 Tax=Cellulomonas alba TaxID=3053467 RepID=A0ABT7SAT8_9CELL|nr:hypothetical protein [Cellulomonas alba]MDM7853302.1 hypothetical protein [Cellulomonas alba]